MDDPLIRILDASKAFARPGWVFRPAPQQAVESVTLSVNRGETLGIVGESGSGKSTLLRMILRLVRPTQGRIEFAGEDVWSLRGSSLQAFRRQVQPIFQNPASSFNPRQRVRELLSAPLQVHRSAPQSEHQRIVTSILDAVGLTAAHASRFPHQLSGGEKQRVAIARAVILSPSVVVADEPTSALDVSVQAQILRLFDAVRRDFGLTAVFVSHDLAVIRQIADRVAVMRAGTVVESGQIDMVFSEPQHEYTRALLAAVPRPRGTRRPAMTTKERS